MSAAPDYSVDFDDVRAAEAEWLAKRRAAEGQPPPNEDVVGLAFSGGGIRSAVFNLGVLQALEAGGLIRKFDYLSTVSGGGYIGSAYSWLRASESRLKAAPTGGPDVGAAFSRDSVFDTPLQNRGGTVLDWLRAHGKYLISHRGFSIWTLLGSILASTLVNVLVLGPALLAAVWALTLAWLPWAWPAWLTLPGVAVPEAHHGYWVLLVAGLACFALFPLVALGFALLAGVPGFAGVDRIDRWRVFMGGLLLGGLALIALGCIPMVALIAPWAQQYFASAQGDELAKHFPWLAPVLSGLGSMLLDKLRGGAGRTRLATIGVALLVYGLLVGLYLVATNVAIMHSPWFLGGVGLSVLLAFVCDINRVSIHAYYRARLSDAFLPPVQGPACADPGEFGLSQLTPERGAPLQLINTTLNTSSSEDERDRARLGANFTFSPLYSGSQQTGWRRIQDYAGGAMALSNAFTISGAAIDPDTYATDARPIAFLMGLLNVRLGYWASNPRNGHLRDPIRPWWWVFLFREMLGIGLDARRRHVHLSDGGGFENLGIYELVRRRLRYIVVCDAGADPDLTLSDLGRAIERVRVDFGAEIELAADSIYHERTKLLDQQPWALGTVRYADGSRGDILYIKPLMCAGLSADIYAYWRAKPAFPDEPTSEQFFTEPQFEAYRCLGQQIVAHLIGGEPPTSIAQWFRQLRAVGAALAATSTTSRG